MDYSASNPGHGAGRRRLAVRFAFTFAMATLAFLLLFRFAGETKLMDAYLFGVARDTSILLALIGESCSMENPEQFKGREAEIRKALCTWQGQPETSAPAGEATPISAWEAWRYRALRLRSEAKAYHAAQQELTKPSPNAEINSPAEHVAYVRGRLAVLEAFVPGAGSGAPACEALPGLVQFVQDTQRTLLEMGAGAQAPGLDAAAFGQRLLDIQREIEGWREQQSAFVADRAGKLDARIREYGPRVDFVFRGKGQDSARELRFRFDVVPDCGALPSIAVFVSAILAFPAPWRRKLVGVIGGLPVLYGVNLLRLACLAVIGAIDTEGRWFTFAHEYVWQGVYIICEVTLWLIWLELVVRRVPAAAPPKNVGQEAAP